MSLPLPNDFVEDRSSAFHVDSRPARCANTQCTRRPHAENRFCAGCWSRLRKGTRERIITCHTLRNKPGLALLERRANSELRNATKVLPPTKGNRQR